MGGKLITKQMQELRLRKTEYNKSKSVVARVTLSARFYLPFTSNFDENDWLTWDATAQAMSDVICEYLIFVDKCSPSVQWQHWVGSNMRPVVRARLEGIVRRKPTMVEWDGQLETCDINNGSIGEYGVSAMFSSSRHTLTTWPKRHAHLRLDFPVTTDIEEVAALFERFSGKLSASYAHMGYMFKEEPARRRGKAQIEQKLKNLHGVAPGTQGVANNIHGHTYGAHWMNSVSSELMQSLVEHADAPPVFNKTSVSEIEGGWIFRTSDLPLAGNMVKGLRELGGMPELAAFLRPLRVTSKYIAQWAARFDPS